MFKKLKKKIASVRKKQSKRIIIKTFIDGKEIHSYSQNKISRKEQT